MTNESRLSERFLPRHGYRDPCSYQGIRQSPPSVVKFRRLVIFLCIKEHTRAKSVLAFDPLILAGPAAVHRASFVDCPRKRSCHDHGHRRFRLRLRRATGGHQALRQCVFMAPEQTLQALSSRTVSEIRHLRRRHLRVLLGAVFVRILGADIFQPLVLAHVPVGNCR